MITYFRILVLEVSVLNCAVMLYDCIFQTSQHKIVTLCYIVSWYFRFWVGNL